MEQIQAEEVMEKSLDEMLGDLHRGITMVEIRLKMLKSAIGGQATIEELKEEARPTKARARRKTVAPKKTVSKSVARGRTLQGRYMGAIRSLSPRKLAMVKKVRVKHGVERAINYARQLAK